MCVGALHGGMLAISLLGCMPSRHAFQFKLECSTQVHAPGQACGSSTTELAGNQEIRRTQAQCDVRRRYIISNGAVCSACMSLHVQRLSNIVRFRTRGIASGAASTSQTDAIIAESVVPQLQEVLVWTGYVYARLLKCWVQHAHTVTFYNSTVAGDRAYRPILPQPQTPAVESCLHFLSLWFIPFQNLVAIFFNSSKLTVQP